MEAEGGATRMHEEEDSPGGDVVPQKHSVSQWRRSMDIPLHISCSKCHHWHNKYRFHLSKDIHELTTACCEKCHHKMFGLGDNSTQSTFASQETQFQSPRSSLVCNNRPIILIDTSHAGLPNHVDPLDPIVERSPISDAASEHASATSLRRSHSSQRVETAHSLVTPAAESSTRASNDGSTATRGLVASLSRQEHTISTRGNLHSHRRKLNYIQNTTAKFRELVGTWRAKLSGLRKKQIPAHPTPSVSALKDRKVPKSASVASQTLSMATEARVSPPRSPDLGGITEPPRTRPCGSIGLLNSPTTESEVENTGCDHLHSHEQEQKLKRIERKRQQKTQEAKKSGCRCDRYCHCMQDSSCGGNEHSERSLSPERMPDHRLPLGVESSPEDTDVVDTVERASTGGPESPSRFPPRSANRVSFAGIGDIFTDNDSPPPSRDTFSISSWDGLSQTGSDSVGAYSSQAPTIVSIGSQVSVIQHYPSGGATTSRPQTPGLLTDNLTAGPDSDGEDHTPTQSRPNGGARERDVPHTPTRSYFDEHRLNGEASANDHF
ncbi:MAG: hypothetical protein M1836_001850 [Candelina mexicana]|nr:MAG: hypothetical protein M1836_001850 [Candelina mexicana]